MKKSLSLFCAALAVSGCANNMEITSPPVNVTRHSGFDTARYQGDHPVNVRSFFTAKKSNGGEERTEFSGAQCRIQGRGFTAKFSTPAIVNLPDHGFYSQAVTGQCATGEAVRPVVAKPYNITVANIKSNNGAGGGVLGMVVAGVANSIALAANDPTNDDYGYHNISVKFPATAQPAGQ